MRSDVAFRGDPDSRSNLLGFVKRVRRQKSKLVFVRMFEEILLQARDLEPQERDARPQSTIALKQASTSGSAITLEQSAIVSPRSTCKQ